MKILLCHRPGGAFGYISDGWINALRDRGHQVQRWDGLEQSWYDYSPDLYIGCSGHKQPIPDKRATKIALHVNPHGPVDIKGINETQETIKWTVDRKPDVVFGYGNEEDRLLWSYWTTRHGIPWIPMPVAGDKTIYKSTSEEHKIYDIVYLGGRWAYKGLTIDSYLIPVLRNMPNSKLYGWGDWPKDLCHGILAEDKVSAFLGSGKIGPCISESHTHQYGIDIPERAFKVALCNTLVIHDCVPVIRRMIPSAIVAANPENFKNLCEHYARPEMEEERIHLSKLQREEVLKENTYHHRMASVLSATGFESESINMLI